MFPKSYTGRPALLGVVLAGLLQSASAATVFQDSFESGALGSAWSTSATGDGRVAVTSEFQPANGSKHLLLDDSNNDLTYSVAEATLKLNLTGKKNVVLSFKAKSLGNEPHEPPFTFFSSSTRNYDGVAITVSGGSTWRTVQSLATTATGWQAYSISLDGLVSPLGADVRIRFSGYDNSSAPIDGIAIDEVSVTADDDVRAEVQLPSPVTEGAEAQTGSVTISPAVTVDTTLSLVPSPTGQLDLPASVTIPAGQTSANFSFSVPDDNIVNLTRSILVKATAPGVTSTAGIVTIYDDEAPTPTLSLPAELPETEYNTTHPANATVSLDRAAAAPLTLFLSSNPAILSVGNNITIPAGQKQATFAVYASRDYKATGDYTVTGTVSAPGITGATDQTVIRDMDQRTFSVSLPATIQENVTGQGAVSIPATVQSNVTVQLSSSDPTVANVPTMVVIPAGQRNASFSITPVNNALRDGSRTVTVTAAANDFTSGSATTVIRDDEVAGYRVAPATDIVNATAPVSFTVAALDVQANAINAASRLVSVELVLPNGTAQPATPPTMTLAGTSTTGTLALPANITPPYRIRITDVENNRGDSSLFDTIRSLPISTNDLVWDATRGRIYASVTTSSPNNANQVIAIDPVTLQITGSAPVGNSPSKLALTGGGEALYVILTATKQIARIDPQSMSVVSTFPVGSDQYGALSANDIAAVAGQPNLVVVARSGTFSGNTVVAVYDNGVPRENVVGGASGVEASADPSIFFGAGSGLRVMQLGPTGLTLTAYNQFAATSSDMAADGSLIVVGRTAIDGATLQQIGSFMSGNVNPRGGPDRALNRAYFIEQPTHDSSQLDTVSAYDASSLAQIARLRMPLLSFSSFAFTPPIRWGSDGLAFGANNSILILNTPQIVPTAQPADLRVSLQATPASVEAGDAVSYAMSVTNDGPNVAKNVTLTATLSDGQAVTAVTSTSGSIARNGSVFTLTAGDIPAGASTSLSIVANPQSVGSVSCSVKATASSPDPDFKNNIAAKIVPVSYRNSIDSVNTLRLDTNNVVSDATRNLLWATTPALAGFALERSIVSIDPQTGQVSEPISLFGTPASDSMAISHNGRYLYVGLSDAPVVVRVDLSVSPAVVTRIPLASVDNYSITYAQEIAVLEGDGTSFIFAATRNNGVAVYDGFVQRPQTAESSGPDQIEPTADPNVFVGTREVSNNPLTKFLVSQNGVAEGPSRSGLSGGVIRASGDLLLSRSGRLANSSALTLEASYPSQGVPALDAPRARAFLTSGGIVRAYAMMSGDFIAEMPLPGLSGAYPELPRSSLRWGEDGFAVNAQDKLFLFRWSATLSGNPESSVDDGSVNPAPTVPGEGVPSQSLVEMPSPVSEGTGPHTGYVLLSATTSGDLTLNLTASPAGQLVLPASVTVPAGQSSASFQFSVANDAAVNLNRTISVSANASGVTANSGTVTVYDDDAPQMSITLPPHFLEGAFSSGTNATLTLDRPATQGIEVSFTANPPLLGVSNAYVNAGQTKVGISVSAVNDNAITGDRVVTITATSRGLSSASAQTLYIDRNQRVLSLELPATLQENASATGTVTIGGTLTQNVVVQLANSNQGAATVPSSVIIPAGSISNTFTITGHDQGVGTGSRSILITASAPTFTSTSAPVTITDSDVGGYRASLPSDIVNIDAGVPIAITATDASGRAINGVMGSVLLSVVAKDGSTTPLTPTAVALNGSTTDVIVTIPPNLTPPLRIRVSDSMGNSGDSAVFDPMRTLGLTAADLVWDAGRNRFYASIPATAPADANRVVAIDPATIQIVGSVAVGQDPGTLALTPGGEALYVGLNGNGRVVRIDPQTMSVVGSFSLNFAQFGGPLRASDIATVAGQPDTIVVERKELNSSYSSGVAVYDNGVMRPNISGTEGIEASADPQIFFSNYYGFRKYRLDPNGLTLIATAELSGGSATMQADGNLLLSDTSLIDGANLRQLGRFTLTGQNGLAAFRPDLAANRAYLIENLSSGSGASANTISAYDATTFAPLRRATMPTASSVASLIRWGSDGLAFRSSNSINLVRASQLVPADAATDLQVEIEPLPASAAANTTETYTVRVTNSGPEIARNAAVNVTLSDGQLLQQVDAGARAPVVNGSLVTLQIGDLAPGASATMNISTLLQNVGSVSCTAQVTMSSRDLASANDFAFKLVPIGFNSGADATNQLRLPANNLIFDSSHNLVWATFPTTVPPPLGGSLIAIDPTTGLISDPIPLNGTPTKGCIALSGNDRYLHVGLSNVPAVARIDLSASTYSSTRIWLGSISGAGYANYPQDIEVLDGDGTSFITGGSDGAAVYDGEVRRPQTTSLYTANRIERGGSPDSFVAKVTGISSNPANILSVTANGVTVTRTLDNAILGGEIRTAGNLLFSSGGQLADATTLAVRASVGGPAQPCVDGPNGRAYQISGTEIRAFDPSNGARKGTFYLPTGRSDDWATTAVRWGADGFAIAGAGSVYLARWSAVDRSNVDENGDGIADLWALAHFGTTNIDLAADPDVDGISTGLEYFHGTLPLQVDANPLQFGIETVGDSRVLHLVFPKRASIPAAHYVYQASTDLQQWNAAGNVTETILRTWTTGGVQYQLIDAAIPAPDGARSFVRINWLGPQ